MKYQMYILFLLGLLSASSLAQIPEPTPVGDINGDGIVDWHDLLVIAQYWQVTGSMNTPTPTTHETPTLTPTQTPLVYAHPRAPTNVRFEGEKVPGSSWRNAFYESVTIRWDPIHGLDVENSPNYYLIDFFSADDFGEGIFYFSLRVNRTYVTFSLNDEFPEPDAKDALQMEGLDFNICGVLVDSNGRVLAVGERSQMLRFWLYPRPTPTPTPTAILTPTP